MTQLRAALFTILISCTAQAAMALDILPGEVSINGVEFVLIPKGDFTHTVQGDGSRHMGDSSGMFRNLRIWLDDFYLAKFEARASDQLRFMNSGEVPTAVLDRMLKARSDDGCTVRKGDDGSYHLFKPGQDLPATSLSWELADAFARWMGFRLPTEMEWEKAARGNDRRIWPWGDAYPDDTYAHFAATSECDPVPVDRFTKGQSPYGLHNMAGNASEHVSNWYNQDHDASLKDGDRNPLPAEFGDEEPFDMPVRINKGGRWSNSPRHIAIPVRRLVRPSRARMADGVRFAIDATLVKQKLKDGTAVPLVE